MKSRYRGDEGALLKENSYCRAWRWLRFDDTGTVKFTPGGAKGKSIGLAAPVYRRWFSQGWLVYRLELGWRVQLKASVLDERGLVACLRQLFDTNVHLRTGAKDFRSVRLGDLDTRSLDALQSASSKQKADLSTIPKWCSDTGDSLVYIEYSPSEVSSLGPQFRAIAPPSTGDPVPPIYSSMQEFRGKSVRVLLVARDDSLQVDRTVSRLIRLHIMRMHAEMEGLEILYQWLKDDRVNKKGTSDAKKTDLQKTLDYARYILNALHDDRGEETDSLPFRVARKVCEAGPQTNFSRYCDEVITFYLNNAPDSEDAKAFLKSIYPKKPIPMSINFNGTVNNPIINNNEAGSTVNNTLNVYNTQSPEFQAALAQVTQLVASIKGQIPESDAKAALEKHAKELEEPNRPAAWYQVSAEGLKKAAENIGAIADPIFNVAERLVGIVNPAAGLALKAADKKD